MEIIIKFKLSLNYYLELEDEQQVREFAGILKPEQDPADIEIECLEKDPPKMMCGKLVDVSILEEHLEERG